MLPITPLKILRHPDRARSGIADFRTPPIHLEVDSTNACNNHCPRCTYKDQKSLPPRYLPTNLAKEAISQAADFGIKAVTFTGDGDPVLHPGFPEILAHVRGQSLEAGLITSGLDYDRELAEKTLPHLSWVRFSVDAGSPDVYAIAHGLKADSFFKTTNNIRDAVEVRKANNLSVRLGASYLVFEPNRPDFIKAMEFKKELGLDYLQFKPIRLPNALAVGGAYHDVTSLLPAYQILGAIKQSSPDVNSVILSKFSMLTRRAYQRCFAQQWATALGSDGQIYVCCEYKYDPRFRLGNILNNSIQNIWQSEDRRKIIETLDPTKSCFLGCKFNDLNNILAEALSSPEGFDKLLEQNAGLSEITDVNFI